MARDAYRVMLVLGLLLGTWNQDGLAQSVSARAVAADIHHRLIGGVMGGGFTVGIPVMTRRLDLRLGLEYLRGTSNRTGSVCSGFLPPVGCVVEPLADRATSTAGSVGLGLTVVQTSAVDLALIGDLSLAKLDVTTRGLATGGRLTADKSMWRGEVGLESTWRPSAQTPLALLLGGGIGRQNPINHEAVADGYTPLEDGSRIARIWVGVKWSPTR